jgi:hypothetical protein
MKNLLLSLMLVLLMVANRATVYGDDRLYELRVYTPEPDRQSDVLKLIEGPGKKFLAKHKIELVGAWIPEDASDSRVVTLVRHLDRKTGDANWTAFQADPEWQTALKASEVNGKKPVQSFDRIFLSVNDYSPELNIETVGNRVFELRTYIASPKNLPALNARFRNHTLGLFKKHGMTNVIYWSVADGEKTTAKSLLNSVSPVGKSAADVSDDLEAVDNSLVYFITHASQDAAKASFDSFRQDDAWNKARTESEKAAGGSLTAGNGVKSWFLKPVAFSPLK